MKIEITEDAYAALQEAMGGSGVDNESDMIIGMFEFTEIQTAAYMKTRDAFSIAIRCLLYFENEGSFHNHPSRIVLSQLRELGHGKLIDRLKAEGNLDPRLSKFTENVSK